MKAVSRRSFIKSAAAFGALAAAGSATQQVWTPMAHAADEGEDDGARVVTSACRNCYGRCTIVGTVQNGRLVKVEPKDGTFSRGTVCSKAYAIPDLVNSPLRVRYPMKRVGERGEGKWERITWDEAWDIIIPKIKEIQEQYGENTILHNFGTGRDQFLIGAVGSVWSQLGSVGTFGVGNLCKIGGDFVQRTTIGNPCQFTGWNPQDSNLIIWWARGLFSWGAYDWLYVKEAMEHGAKFMVVDPRQTPATAKADHWVPIRPHSDGALVLAIINEMLQSGRFDQEFTREWTSGPFLTNEDAGLLLRESDIVEGGSQTRVAYWDEGTNGVEYWDTAELSWSVEDHRPALFGSYDVAGVQRRTGLEVLKESCSEWTVQKCAETTWLSEEMVRETIELYISSSPGACFSRGQKTDFSNNTSGISHAFTIMMAIAGNYEVPGGNTVMATTKKVISPSYGRKPVTDIAKKIDSDPDAYSINPGKYKIYGNIGGTAGSTLEAMLTGEPFKPRMLWEETANPIMSSAQAQDIEKCFKELDFVVHVSLLMDPSTEMSDVVLPAAHQNEVDRIEFAQSGHCYPGNASVTIRQPFTEPQGEALDDIDILRELANRMDIGDIFPDKYKIYDTCLEPVGMTFEEFREQELVQGAEPIFRQHEKGLLRKDHKPGFMTSTGKVNIYSEELSKFGHGPIPTYIEQPETLVSDPEGAEEYPLELIAGGRSHQYFHSEYHESPRMRAIHPYPLVEINPQTAAENGIEDGDWVVIESRYGRIKQLAYLTDGIHPRIIHCEHDFWYPEKSALQGNHGAHDSNPNSIFTNVTKEQDPAIGTNCFGALVKIYKSPDGPPEGIISGPEDLEMFVATAEESATFFETGEDR